MIRVVGSDGNYIDCTTDTFYIDKTAPKCPTFTYSGTRGDEYKETNDEIGWFKEGNVKLKVKPTDDTVYWTWATNNNGGSYEQHTTEYHGPDEVQFKAEGLRRAKITVYDAAGNSQDCKTKKVKLDKTAPVIDFTDGPKKSTCGEKKLKSITTKYKVEDEISGLKVVKDFYGYNSTIPGADDSNWRNRTSKFTKGAKSFTHTHNWNSNCKTKNQPGNNCYYLKYYLKDVAGNVRSGKSQECVQY